MIMLMMIKNKRAPESGNSESLWMDFVILVIVLIAA
jgi:hypothetical protein